MSKRHAQQMLRETVGKMQEAIGAIACDAMADAVTQAGGQSKLAELLGGGVSRQAVHNWCKRGAPEAQCAAIEQCTGVSIERLAPLADAASLRASFGAKSITHVIPLSGEGSL